MNEKKKILLLGGTGAMGVYLTPELLQQGYQVYITTRRDHESTDPDLIYITGNAKDMAFLQPVLQQKFDAIVDFMIYKTDEFRARHLELLDATPHYVFVSSYRVYGDNHGKPIREDSPRLLDSVQDPEYLKTDEYALTKARQENILRESGRSNWTIVRPAVTYSKERFQLGTLEAADFVKRALAGKAIIFPKQMLNKQATMSWAGDVSKLISRLILNTQAMAEAFTVSSSEHHTWREIMGYYQKILGLQVKLVDLAVYQDVIGGPYQIKYDRMLDRVIDNSKVLAITGMSQSDFMPLEKGLAMELAEFIKNPSYRGFLPARDRKVDEVLATSKPDPVVIKKMKTLVRVIREGKVLSVLSAKLRRLGKSD